MQACVPLDGAQVTTLPADTVSMVFPEDRLMAKMFNEEMAKFYEKYYENKGVTLVKGDTVTGFEGDGKVQSMFCFLIKQ